MTNIILLQDTSNYTRRLYTCIESIIHTQKNVTLYLILNKPIEINIHTTKTQNIRKYLISDLHDEQITEFNKHYEHYNDQTEEYIKNEFLNVFYLNSLMKKLHVPNTWVFTPSTLILTDLEELTKYIDMPMPMSKTGYLSELHNVHTSRLSNEIVEHYCTAVNQLYKNHGSKQVMHEIYKNMVSNHQSGGICSMTMWDWILNDCFNINMGFIIRPLHQILADNSIFDINFIASDKHYSKLIGIQNNVFESDYTVVKDNLNQAEIINHKRIFKKYGTVGIFYRSSLDNNNNNTSVSLSLLPPKHVHKVNTIHFDEPEELLQITVWNMLNSTFFSGDVPQYQVSIHLLCENKVKQRY